MDIPDCRHTIYPVLERFTWKHFVILAMVLLLVPGMNACDPAQERTLFCDPNNDPAPECIHDNVSSAAAGSGHVLILPGISGSTNLLSQVFGFEEEVDNQIDNYSLWSSQVWDWTQEADSVDLITLEEDLPKRLFEKQKLHNVAARLARMICEWSSRPLNQGKELSLLCGSGGALVALLACEATDAFGTRLLPPNFKFNTIVLASPAFSTSRSMAHLAERSKRGVFVYYSSNDGTLLGGTCPSAEVSFDFPWPAVGRYGIHRDDPNCQYVAGQLGWQPNDLQLNNSGEHLACYRAEFFRRYFLPVLTGGDFPSEWQSTINQHYLAPEVDVIVRSVPSPCADNSAGCIERTDGRPLVLILPGPQGILRENTVADLIEDELEVRTQVWDWTALDALAGLDDEERASTEALEQAAVALVGALLEWQETNHAPVFVLAGSSGTTITILACNARNEDGTSLIPDEFFERVIFTSGTHSTFQTLEQTARCTRRGVYNYFSVKNTDAAGTIECVEESSDNANLDEALIEAMMASVTDAVPWPAAGRFGYRESNGENFHWVTAQLGWVEDFEQLGNRGNALDEYDRRFFEEYFLPLFSEGSVSLAPEWKHNAPAAYEDVDDSGAGTSLSVETCLSLFATP